MNNRDYHADTTRISKSGLDLIARSPRHYWERYLNPYRQPERETPALIAGRVIHTAILEPHLFNDEYVILPEINRRTNAGKEQYERFISDNAGKTVIDIDVYDMAQRMRDAVHKNPAAAELLRIGIPEHTVLFNHPDTGSKCKCRFDFLTADGIIVDLKTTEDAGPEAFGRSAFNYRYHVQSSYYSDGYSLDRGYAPDGFVFIAVEKSPPYGVALYYANESTINLGRETYIPELHRYQACVNTGLWPAYSERIEELKLPAYAFRKTH